MELPKLLRICSFRGDKDELICKRRLSGTVIWKFD